MANIPFLNNASFSANATFAGTVSHGAKLEVI